MVDTLWKRNVSVISGPEEALAEPVSAQGSEDTSQEASAGGLDVGECEKRAREMLGVRRTLPVGLRSRLFKPASLFFFGPQFPHPLCEWWHGSDFIIKQS